MLVSQLKLYGCIYHSNFSYFVVLESVLIPLQLPGTEIIGL